MTDLVLPEVPGHYWEIAPHASLCYTVIRLRTGTPPKRWWHVYVHPRKHNIVFESSVRNGLDVEHLLSTEAARMKRLLDLEANLAHPLYGQYTKSP